MIVAEYEKEYYYCLLACRALECHWTKLRPLIVSNCVGCRFIHCHTRSCSSALQNWIRRWSVKLKSCGNVTRLNDSLLLTQLMLKRGGYQSTNSVALLTSWLTMHVTLLAVHVTLQ